MGVRTHARFRLGVFACALLTLASSASLLHAQAGPQKTKIASIQATGSRKFTEAQIAEASGLRPGDVVSREEIQAAADALAQLGLFSKANYRFTSRGDELTVEFQVEDAPAVPVSFDNFPWFTDDELTAALKQKVVLFDGTAPEQGALLDAMAAALQKLIATRGIQGTVEHTLMAQPAGDGMMQQFKFVGAGLKVHAVQFGDPLASESKRIQERLPDVLGKPFSRFAIEVFANEQVRPVYLERGHLRVRFGRPEARFTGNPDRPLPDTILVFLPIEPGPAYQWAGAEWRGVAALDSAALNEFLGLKPGDLADGMKLAGAWQRVENEYGRRGYLDVKIAPKPEFDDAATRVRYRVEVREGPQYRMGEMVLTGLSLVAERKLLAAWTLPRGQVFDRMYFQDFLDAGIKKALADMPVRYDQVGHWLRPNPATRTVDVLLDFK